MIGLRQNKQPLYLWNPEIHEQWGKERQYFWCLHFKPTYDREAIIEALSRLFEDQKVLSYAVYETTGWFDFFIRLWLPTSLTPDDFERALQDGLGRVHINNQDRFRVSEIACHWVWRNKKGAMDRPSAEVLSRQLADAEIAKINKGNVGRSEKKYIDAHLIAPCQPRNGIKFIIVVNSEERHIQSQPELRHAMANRLREILDKTKRIHEKSLYIGEGFGQFLMLGRVAHEDFGGIYDDLVDQINQRELREFFKIRTYTYIVQRSPFDSGYFRDQLASSTEVAAPDVAPIEEYLSSSEDEKLEFKGSAWVDIKEWINRGTTNRNDTIFNDGVLRAVVAMLNSAGGNIIVGVLERRKFEWPTAAQKLKDLPTFADNIVCGIDLDCGKNGWDWFQLRIQDLINERVTPAPRAWLNVKRVEFQGRTLCIISVRKPSDDWFYLKGDARFWVREGASSRELPGPEADVYKRANSRR